jgi:hypothetical protein
VIMNGGEPCLAPFCIGLGIVAMVAALAVRRIHDPEGRTGAVSELQLTLTTGCQ